MMTPFACDLDHSYRAPFGLYAPISVVAPPATRPYGEGHWLARQQGDKFMVFNIAIPNIDFDVTDEEMTKLSMSASLSTFAEDWGGPENDIWDTL